MASFCTLHTCGVRGGDMSSRYRRAQLQIRSLGQQYGVQPSHRQSARLRIDIGKPMGNPMHAKACIFMPRSRFGLRSKPSKASLYFFCIFRIFKCHRKTRQRYACLFCFSHNFKYRKTCFTIVVFHKKPR